eukprot:COSAG06_NODE_4_length_41837_cov_204.557597_16_plen_74_part_00
MPVEKRKKGCFPHLAACFHSPRDDFNLTSRDLLVEIFQPRQPPQLLFPKPACKKAGLVLSLPPYICPEPVLVK